MLYIIGGASWTLHEPQLEVGPLRLKQIDDQPMSTSLKSQQARGTRTTAMHAGKFRPCAHVSRQRRNMTMHCGARSLQMTVLLKRIYAQRFCIEGCPARSTKVAQELESREARRTISDILYQLQRFLDGLLSPPASEPYFLPSPALINDPGHLKGMQT